LLKNWRRNGVLRFNTAPDKHGLTMELSVVKRQSVHPGLKPSALGKIISTVVIPMIKQVAI
jgi:hypothetical protein